MKKFILQILLLAALIACCDFLFGKVMNYVVSNITVGGQGRSNYICNQANEDVLVFGCSRAVHHYNSKMIEDSLCMSCYNCGNDGNGIILSYARLKMIKERSEPKIIIEDIFPEYDYFVNDNRKYLGWLRAYYDKEGVADIFYDIDKTERYKMASQLYRYNSRFIQNITTFAFNKAYDGGIKGFRPLNKEFDTMKISAYAPIYSVDTIKLKYIEGLIDLADSAKVFFVASPIWYGMDSIYTAPIREICKKRNIPFLDFTNDPKYVKNSEYFVDGTHLNSRGADEFTKDLISILRKDSIFSH